MSDAAGLRVTGLHKSFGGVHALRGVDFDVRPGQVHALLGHNGAGKSTLITALGGGFAPDAGSIEVAGTTYDALTPRQSIAAGIAIIFQHLSLVDSLTVADNIFLGHERSRAGVLHQRAQRTAAAALLDRLGGACSPTDRVADLPMGQRQLVEIAKALSRSPSVIVLDEPTAALSAPEVLALERRVQGLRDDGLAIVYVTHLLGEVERLADRLTVLRDGRVHLSASMAGLTRHDLIAAIAEPYDGPPAGQPTAGHGRERLVLSSLEGAGCGPVDLSIRAGEIVGLYGLIGSGRTRLLETVFGKRRSRAGTVAVDGRVVRRPGPRTSRAIGLALVPGDRAGQGLFASLSSQDNALLPVQATLARFGLRSRRRERALFAELADDVGLRPADPGLRASAFSGGNQQKLLLGRWVHPGLQTGVLLLDEPTQGVDVRARQEIYTVVRRLAADRGIAVLFASTDPEEVGALADRCLVMSHGRVVHELQGHDLTEHALLDATQQEPLSTETKGPPRR